ncbi:hypothetical protein PQX77_010353 [Marasmius sp. AFHP31]|nr:hypothetical protein PQX77_010353 [Marasmius sp. AFHP31]
MNPQQMRMMVQCSDVPADNLRGKMPDEMLRVLEANRQMLQLMKQDQNMFETLCPPGQPSNPGGVSIGHDGGMPGQLLRTNSSKRLREDDEAAEGARVAPSVATHATAGPSSQADGSVSKPPPLKKFRSQQNGPPNQELKNKEGAVDSSEGWLDKSSDSWWLEVLSSVSQAHIYDNRRPSFAATEEVSPIGGACAL